MQATVNYHEMINTEPAVQSYSFKSDIAILPGGSG